MPIYTVVPGGNMPSDLVGKVTPDLWMAVSSAIRKADSDAEFLACALEITVCVCTCLFCIFFVHPQIQNQFSTQNRTSELNKINAAMCGGKVVFTCVGANIIVNTDYLEQVPINKIVQATVVQATPVIQNDAPAAP